MKTIISLKHKMQMLVDPNRAYSNLSSPQPQTSLLPSSNPGVYKIPDYEYLQFLNSFKELCSTYYPRDNSIYIIIIVFLLIVIVFLIKKLLKV